MKITLSELVHSKVKHWVHKQDLEVSGFGLTEVREVNGVKEVYVHDCYLLEQEVGMAHTDIDAASLGKLMSRVLADRTLRKYQLNWWWHSHVDMNVFWSSTDVDTIKSIGKNGLCIATVFNKKGEMRSAISYPTTHPILGEQLQLLDNVDTFFEYNIDPRTKDWDEEFTLNVKRKTFTRWTDSDTDDYQYGGHGRLLETGAGKTNDVAFGKDLWDEGLMGWGVVDEARQLGLQPWPYYNKLVRWDEKEIKELEDKLEALIQAEVRT